MDTKSLIAVFLSMATILGGALLMLNMTHTSALARYEHQAKQHQKCLDANERIAMLQLEQGRSSIEIRDSIRCPEIR